MIAEDVLRCLEQHLCKWESHRVPLFSERSVTPCWCDYALLRCCSDHKE